MSYIAACQTIFLEFQKRIKTIKFMERFENIEGATNTMSTFFDKQRYF